MTAYEPLKQYPHLFAPYAKRKGIHEFYGGLKSRTVMTNVGMEKWFKEEFVRLYNSNDSIFEQLKKIGLKEKAKNTFFDSIASFYPLLLPVEKKAKYAVMDKSERAFWNSGFQFSNEKSSTKGEIRLFPQSRF